jgi:hypothetical protein
LVNLEFTRHWVYTVTFLITEVEFLQENLKTPKSNTNTTRGQTPFILWLSVLLVEETGVPVENHRPVASHRQTVSHNVVSSTPRLSEIRAHNVSGDTH